jgi:hypothetical protein
MYCQVLQMVIILVQTHTISPPTFLFGQAELKTTIFFTYDEDTMVLLPTYARQRTKTLSQVQLIWMSIDAQGHSHWHSTKQHCIAQGHSCWHSTKLHHIMHVQCNSMNMHKGRKIDPHNSSNGANLHTCRKI